ncbi:cyanide hydratase [Geosmithia morbida]|uniref:nitrilase n=1 Tax=Geosmithia morbida TaxID=1094350 RepID=A0A9P4YYW9_9HYPO|nr:cyanide hydratase [Geosmithia morbida]KAF4124301.1 cyanide hydratase [Geosmithia morbida]
MSIRQWKAAVSQAEPCWFDLEAGVDKAISLIGEAASNGAALIAFSEVWLPGYPNFIWSGTYQENHPLVLKYMRNSMTAYGPEMLRIRQAVADHKMHAVLGFSERAGGSLYLAQVLIGPDGNILLHRRKLKPTHMERTIFGDSTGDSLNNVVDTPLGKIGMLNCWEHLQPLLKFHTYAQGEQVHVASWPSFAYKDAGPYPLSAAATLSATETYALEGQSFVLLANQPISRAGQILNTDGQAASKGDATTDVGGGIARVYGPDARTLTTPTDPNFDGLVYCDIDLDKIDEAKTLADPVGHYSRPDLLRVLVDDQPKAVVARVDPSASSASSAARTLTSTHAPLATAEEPAASPSE